jgi:hypothetical protein
VIADNEQERDCTSNSNTSQESHIYKIITLTVNLTVSGTENDSICLKACSPMHDNRSICWRGSWSEKPWLRACTSFNLGNIGAVTSNFAYHALQPLDFRWCRLVLQAKWATFCYTVYDRQQKLSKVSTCPWIITVNEVSIWTNSILSPSVNLQSSSAVYHEFDINAYECDVSTVNGNTVRQGIWQNAGRQHHTLLTDVQCGSKDVL